MHLAVRIDVDIAGAVGVEVLLEETVLVVVLSEFLAFWQSHVGNVQVDGEVDQQLLFPRIAVVLGNHNKGIRKIVECGKRYGIATGVDSVGIAAEGRKVGTIQISEAVIDDVPGVSAVLRSVVEHRTVLAVVNQTTVGRWGRDANDVQAVAVLTAGRHTGPQLTYSEVAGNGGFAPSTSTGVTPRHVERCIDAGVADNHLTTSRGVHD